MNFNFLLILNPEWVHILITLEILAYISNGIFQRNLTKSQLLHFISLFSFIIIIMSYHRHGYPSPSLATSPELHPVSCCIYVLDGRPDFAWPYVGVHRSTSLRSSSLLLQQCPVCLVRLTWIVFVMGGRWPYSWCLVGCCRQDLFNITRKILV